MAMEKLNARPYVFQVDSSIVRECYKINDNYMIEYNSAGDHSMCVVYFSSNDIYFPNEENIFKKRIIENNTYEWYHTRIQGVYKQIFIRDIFKQWYLAGINSKINNPIKLLDFLRKETSGYKTIMLGSSAGGYASILYGSLLNVHKVLAFNPQFEITSLLTDSTEDVNPLLFRLKNSEYEFYFDIRKFINNKIDIFYFYSNKSSWDIKQCKKLKEVSNNIIVLEFSSKHHGIPFLKVALPKVLNLESAKLKEYSLHVQSPVLFTIKMVGVWQALSGLFRQVYKAYKKRH